MGEEGDDIAGVQREQELSEGSGARGIEVRDMVRSWGGGGGEGGSAPSVVTERWGRRWEAGRARDNAALL